MVHKRKKKQDLYVVSGIGGSPLLPYREVFVVRGLKEMRAKIRMLKKRPEVKRIHVDKNGWALLKVSSVFGYKETYDALLKDNPKKTEVVIDNNIWD